MYNNQFGAFDAVLSFIGIIALILYIILFFKVWGMTNNVSDIKKMMSVEKPLSDLLFDNKEELKKMLADKYMEKVAKIIRGGGTNEYLQKKIDAASEFYNKKAEKFGVDIDFNKLSEGLIDKTRCILKVYVFTTLEVIN